MKKTMSFGAQKSINTGALFIDIDESETEQSEVEEPKEEVTTPALSRQTLIRNKK